jgi:heme-degrading monooxygenase HmoA
VIAVVWEIHVRRGDQEEFEKFYGADGEWSRLARRSRSFLGSSFLRDQADDSHYMLVEYWSEMVVYERYKKDFARETREVEDRGKVLCETMRALGIFTGLDVPDRLGPTWSRRDGK